jgi:hypothetical protein
VETNLKVAEIDRRERVKDKVKNGSRKCSGGWDHGQPAAVLTVVVAQASQWDCASETFDRESSKDRELK